jgi:hypothetical protein
MIDSLPLATLTRLAKASSKVLSDQRTRNFGEGIGFAMPTLAVSDIERISASPKASVPIGNKPLFIEVSLLGRLAQKKVWRIGVLLFLQRAITQRVLIGMGMPDRARRNAEPFY